MHISAHIQVQRASKLSNKIYIMELRKSESEAKGEGESATLVLLNHFPLFIIDNLDNPAYTLRFRVYGFRSAHMDADHCNNRHSAPSCIGLCLYHNRAHSGTCSQSEMKSLKTSIQF